MLGLSLSRGLSNMELCSQWNSKENPEYTLTSCFLVFNLPLPKYLILSHVHLPLATHISLQKQEYNTMTHICLWRVLILGNV